MNGANSIGKTSISTRRNLTLDRERGSIAPTAIMKKQASQDTTVMRKATIIDTSTAAK